MASDDPPEMVRELMYVERPVGTQLSQSSTPGALSALARDEDNELVTHADLFPAHNATKVIAAAAFAAGIVVCAAAVKVTPHVKEGFTALKTKLKRKPDEATEEAEPEQPAIGPEQPPRQRRHLHVA